MSFEKFVNDVVTAVNIRMNSSGFPNSDKLFIENLVAHIDQSVINYCYELQPVFAETNIRRKQQALLTFLTNQFNRIPEHLLAPLKDKYDFADDILNAALLPIYVLGLIASSVVNLFILAKGAFDNNSYDDAFVDTLALASSFALACAKSLASMLSIVSRPVSTMVNGYDEAGFFGGVGRYIQGGRFYTGDNPPHEMLFSM